MGLIDMKNIRKYFLAGLAVVGFGLNSTAQNFHCQADTAKAMEIIREFSKPGGKPAGLVAPIALKFVDVPFVEVARMDSLGENQIRLDGFDDFTFVNSVAALAKIATSPGHLRPKDYADALENVSFRRGKADGFSSRMLYGGDWIVDNRSRGNVKELTEDYSDQFKTKSLEWVSRHREDYAALKDSAAFEKQKMVEMGYRTFKIPHLKRESTDWKQINSEIEDGDIIMLLTNNPDMDFRDIGFVVRRQDGLHLIHASRQAGKVVEESEPLGRYIKRLAKEVYGWRWLRIL